MIEKKVKVVTHRIDAYCEACDADEQAGELFYTGLMFPVNPPLYEHRCRRCGAKERLKNVHPNFVHEDESEVK